MATLYAVADGSGTTYNASEAHLYDWFKDEHAAQRFIQKSSFDPMCEGTNFRVDVRLVDDDLLCSLLKQSYESRVNISVIKAPPLQSPHQLALYSAR